MLRVKIDFHGLIASAQASQGNASLSYSQTSPKINSYLNSPAIYCNGCFAHSPKIA